MADNKFDKFLISFTCCSYRWLTMYRHVVKRDRGGGSRKGSSINYQTTLSYILSDVCCSGPARAAAD